MDLHFWFWYIFLDIVSCLSLPQELETVNRLFQIGTSKQIQCIPLTLIKCTISLKKRGIDLVICIIVVLIVDMLPLIKLEAQLLQPSFGLTHFF